MLWRVARREDVTGGHLLLRWDGPKPSSLKGLGFIGFIGFRVEGLGFRVQSSGFKVQGLRFRPVATHPLNLKPCDQACRACVKDSIIIGFHPVPKAGVYSGWLGNV